MGDDSSSIQDGGDEKDDCNDRAPMTMAIAAAGSLGAAVALAPKHAPDSSCVPLWVCMDLRRSCNDMKKEKSELERQLSLARHRLINARLEMRHEKRQLKATICEEKRKAWQQKRQLELAVQAEARKLSDASRELERVKAENTKLKQTIEELKGACAICLKGGATWVAECGCQIFCDSCVEKAHMLSQCPFCRERISVHDRSLYRLRRCT